MNKISNKLIISAYMMLISILLISCNKGTEIDRLAIVTSIGVDIEGEKVVVTFEVLNPGASNSYNTLSEPSSTNFVYPQGVGDTIKDAIEEIGLHFDKKIFLSHSNLIIFGEDFAKRGITDFMDFFLRDNEPREDMYIAIAKEAKAYDILGVRAGLGRSGGNYLYDIFNNFSENGKCINISLVEYYRYYYDVGNEPVIGTVQYREIRQLDREKQKEESKLIILDVSGGAVMSKDSLLGYFTANEMIGFNFILEK